MIRKVYGPNFQEIGNISALSVLFIINSEPSLVLKEHSWKNIFEKYTSNIKVLVRSEFPILRSKGKQNK